MLFRLHRLPTHHRLRKQPNQEEEKEEEKHQHQEEEKEQQQQQQQQTVVPEWGKGEKEGEEDVLQHPHPNRLRHRMPR
jgi:hypothetical protein